MPPTDRSPPQSTGSTCCRGARAPPHRSAGRASEGRARAGLGRAARVATRQIRREALVDVLAFHELEMYGVREEEIQTSNNNPSDVLLFIYPRAPVVPPFRRWDWGGCQECPVIPPEEVRLEPIWDRIE